MIITNLSVQINNKDRVNIFIDKIYFCSLELWQVVDFKLKKDLEIDDNFKQKLEQASKFGKLYAKTVNYCLLRPHSKKEVMDYLRKQFHKLELKNNKMFDGIMTKLESKKFVNDHDYAKWWIDNRNLKKGISFRRLEQELRQKGVEDSIIKELLSNTNRDELSELKKVIAKKAHRYDDEQKLIKYLMSRGFKYDDIKKSLKDI